MHYNFCPHCGYDKLENRMPIMFYCPNCNSEWFNNPVTGCKVILIDSSNQKVILGRRSRNPKKGTWNTIGGFLDIEEDFRSGVVRETSEELGIKLNPENLRYFSTRSNRYLYQTQNLYTTTVFYWTKLSLEQESEMQPGDDIDKIDFFYPEEIVSSDLAFASDKDALDDFLKFYFGINSNLQELRSMIDLYDREILFNLIQRQKVVQKVGKFKKANNLEIFDSKRWQEVKSNLTKLAVENNLPPKLILEIWEKIHLNSLQIEKQV